MANSRTFQNTKQVKEAILERYTSNQLVTTLDDLIYRSLDPIVLNSNLINVIVASIVSWYSSNARRKISTVRKDRTLYLLYHVMSLEGSEKIRVIKRLGLERNIRFFIIDLFRNTAKDYPKLELAYARSKDFVQRNELRAKMHDIEVVLGIDATKVTPVLRQAEFWLSQAHKLRNQIIEKYMRHTVMRAGYYHSSNPERLDLDDVIQNFMLSVNKAINKFNPDRGTLTTYINNWLRNAQSAYVNSHNHEYGIAYSVPANVKRGMAAKTNQLINISTSMHDNPEVDAQYDNSPQPDSIAETDSDITRVRKLAKLVDPKGYARIYMNIGEVLNTNELSKLQSATVG